MFVKKSFCLVALLAFVFSATAAEVAKAQCCGAATTAYYQPAAYTAYSPVTYQAYAPVAYQTYRTGWYPGYYLDRFRARVWGAPNTYVAAYPSTYAASYPTSYYASYPAYTAGYAAYAPVSSCSTCTANYSPCSSCAAVQQVTMRPVCSSCGDSGYASGGTYGVAQTSYEQPSCGCSASSSEGYSQQPAAAGTTIVVPNGTVVTPGASGGMAPPEVPQNFETTPRTSEKPASSDGGSQPDPATDNGTGSEGTPAEAAGSGAQLEAPRLFNPNDRTAQKIGAPLRPVRTALYAQPISQQRQVAKPVIVTAQQAAQDAIGWQSASK